MPNIPLSKNTVFWLVTSFLTIFISYRLYQATTWGAGLTTDSITYLEGARSILRTWNLDGIGTHYPPLYFILIALIGLITGDALEGLRLLQILTLGLNLLLFSLIIWKATNKTLLPTIIGSLLFLTSQSVLFIHTMAWSEGTFCFFALMGFYFLAQYLEHENKRFPLLAFSALFTGLAFITRYVGITLIITEAIALALYVNDKGNKSKRFIDCLYFIFISSFPMFMWMVRNWIVSSEATSRNLVVHAISIERIKIGIQVLLSWLFIPNNFPFILLIILLLMVISYVISIRAIETKHINRILEICSIFVLIYIPFLLISISLFDAHTPLNQRILFPVYLTFILSLVVLSYRIFHAKRIRIVSYFLLFGLCLLVYAQFGIQNKFLLKASSNGIGYASKAWAQSDILQWVEKLPQDSIIYTNGPETIRIIANRSSKMVPRLIFPADRTKNKNIEKEIKDMASEISGNKGVIIYINGITWRWYLPTIKELRQALPLKLKYKSNDGVALIIDD